MPCRVPPPFSTPNSLIHAASQQSTFWVGASLEAKNSVLAAGHTKTGCWVNFSSMMPTPRAHLKAARKRNIRYLLDSEVIDISSGFDHEV
jgi:hypothetical protein